MSQVTKLTFEMVGDRVWSDDEIEEAARELISEYRKGMVTLAKVEVIDEPEIDARTQGSTP